AQEHIEAAAAAATNALTRHVETFKIDRRLRTAVVERAAVRCPFRVLWRDEGAWEDAEPAHWPLRLAAHTDTAAWSWPVNLALRDVATLLMNLRDSHAKRLGRAFLDGTFASLQIGDVSAAAALLHTEHEGFDDELREALTQWDVRLCVLVAGAELDVQESQRRPAIALDAGSVHHELLTGWRDLPKDRKIRKTPVQNGWAEIIYPGKQLGLRLNVQDLPERIVHAVREWKHWQGLRHWAALQLLFTDAGRTGRIRWTLESHLEALGYGDRSRRDPKVRAMVASEVEALTRMEIAIYHPDGTVRLRGPVLAVTQRGEAMRGSEWRLEGLELVIHPVLYDGVRKSSGEIGRLWAPAPVELARIDHVRFPYAIALGLILPIRWRWDLTEDMDYIVLSGAKLMEAAGIKIQQQHPRRAWEALEENLEELKQVGGLGRYEWEEGPPWSLSGRCRLYQPQWVRERMVHGLVPPETTALPMPLTGAELRAWRASRNWTQQEAADQLKVSRRTVIRAEASPDEPLPHSVRAALSSLQQP
ncbi:MAG TPA: helix-turn-helix transcriptional regulator, partial [Tetrasphaera sp.]|uniref:helix-turn-helix transcriptional regulator n=1 Tax=Nostocoides sp. TaxID=1917966 RepID=UPI002B6164E9